MIIDGAGGYYDPGDMPGSGRLRRASLMREGTTTQDVRADLRAARSAGGRRQRRRRDCPRRSRRSTATASIDNLDTVLALMADVLMNPSFPQVEIDRYKTRTRAQLMQNRTQPWLPRGGAPQQGGVRR